jgi:hypothetical protein
MTLTAKLNPSNKFVYIISIDHHINSISHGQEHPNDEVKRISNETKINGTVLKRKIRSKTNKLFNRECGMVIALCYVL